MSSNPDPFVVYFQGLCAVVLNNPEPRTADRGRAVLVGAGFEGDPLNSEEMKNFFNEEFQGRFSVCPHEPYLTFSHSQFVEASDNLEHFTIVRPARESNFRSLLGFVPLRGKHVRFLGDEGELEPRLTVTEDFLGGVIRLRHAGTLRQDVLRGEPEDERIVGRVDLDAGRLFAQRRTEEHMYFQPIGPLDLQAQPEKFNQDAALYIPGNRAHMVIDISPIHGSGPSATLKVETGSRITISNLCHAVEHPPAELDFLAYYELLADPPRVRQRKIPRALPYDTKTGSACPPTFFAMNESF